MLGCYQEEDGCRDLLASNYSVGADFDCDDDCCVYPTINLSVSHRHRDTLLVRDSAYTNTLGQVYRINSVSMLVSDFAIALLGDTLTASEMVVLGDTEERTDINDHFQLSTTEFSYTVGSIAGRGALSSMIFTVGSDHAPGDTTLADDDYRLLSGVPRLAIDRSTYGAVSIVLDSLVTDTLASWKVGGQYPITLDLTGDELIAGDDLTAIIEIDYAQWLDEVDLLADSTSVANAISDKIDAAITIRR